MDQELANRLFGAGALDRTKLDAFNARQAQSQGKPLELDAKRLKGLELGIPEPLLNQYYGAPQPPQPLVDPEPSNVNVLELGQPNQLRQEDQLPVDLPTVYPESIPELAVNAPQEPVQAMPQMPAFNSAGYDLQQMALAEAARTGELRGAEESAALNKIQKEDLERTRQIELMANENAKKLQQRQEDLDTALIQASEKSIDPNRYWKNTSTGGKVQAGIALFLGSFGSASSNLAASTIEKAIDRDIDAQKADMKNNLDSLGQRRGLLSDMRLVFKDQNEAAQAAKIGYLNNTQLKIQQIASKYKGQEARDNAAFLIGQLEVKKQEAKDKFMKDFATQMPVGLDSSPEMLTEEQRKRFVPGYGLALDDDSAKKARPITAAKESIKENINRLLAISKKESSLDPQVRAEAEVIIQTLIGSLSEPLFKGKPTNAEIEYMKELIANPTKIFSLSAVNEKKLQTLRDRMTSAADHELKAFGLTTQDQRLKELEKQLGIKSKAK